MPAAGAQAAAVGTEDPPRVLIEVTGEVMFDKELKLAGDSLVVIHFTANWCMPCQMVKADYEAMLDKNENVAANVIFMRVDVDDNEPLAERYDVQAMPTWILIRNHEVKESITGADIPKLTAKVAELRS
eukprot:gnl/TRDRNA2_/TRDRNA2_185559_c0_seq1.p2 gnl/TRDRNA2_/TRDRNA2_185559_c0~~gnl/TRDRNA2_/TRDRNA2_185559_c0_seq1.p2  ORF type:complete len:129 (-),score=31.48 gnl/TRDRNA2_/TRDRNA2_185559_c0_seq1:211-597(-)